jgi:coenzyme F420-dependent glucose-6-phosphate dehydrogenase
MGGRAVVEIGYALSSEEHPATDLVRHAVLAEEAGFGFALISDHFHPWTDRQGQSPFAWSVLGAIAASTTRLRVGTGVTCPTARIHPLIIAQAAATVGALMPGRFFLGLGTGENLNEHVLGAAWPEWEVRSEMLEEAVDVIQTAWKGATFSHRGRYYTVQSARIYSLPQDLPPIYLAASAEKAIDQAARLGDGLIGTGPDGDLLKRYRTDGGRGPAIGQVTLCWGESVKAARHTAREWWPNVAVQGGASQELPAPTHFEELTQNVTDEELGELISCGPEPQAHLEQIQAYLDAGYDQVYLHQIGPDQRGFIEFAARELMPAFGTSLEPATAGAR